MKTTFVLLAFALVAINSAYGRECYTCFNCDEIPSDLKQAKCTAEGTVPPELFPTPSPSTNAPDTTTTPVVTTTVDPDAGNGGSNGGTGSNPTDTKIIANKYDRDGDAKDEYKCFTYSLALGSGKIVNRGCTKLEKCEKLTVAPLDKVISDCDFCEEDGCNPANNIKSWALSSVILVAIIKMFL